MDENDVWVRLLKSDRRFSAETYRFANEAIEYAQELGMGRPAASEPNPECDVEVDELENHVTGQDLCAAAKDLAIKRYGFLAKTVLARLGLRTTGDFGDVVYNMIAAGLMTKTPEDSRADFDDVFDLGKELEAGFAFHYEKKRRS